MHKIILGEAWLERASDAAVLRRFVRRRRRCACRLLDVQEGEKAYSSKEDREGD